jgi:hypothetical protein
MRNHPDALNVDEVDRSRPKSAPIPFPAAADAAGGAWRGALAEGYDEPAFLTALRRALTAGGGGAAAGQGGTWIWPFDAPSQGGAIPLMIKAHPPDAGWKRWADRRRGTAAERAWRTAVQLRARGVGTPEPVAWLERWEQGRRGESWFVTRRLEGMTNFRDAVRDLFLHDPDAGRMMALLQTVATAVRAMHEAGVRHGDLGNQNILLQRTPEGWDDVAFIDLNRAQRQDTPLTMRQRARDLARICLPSDLLRIFLEMYFNERGPPEFFRALRFHRRHYAWHHWSRRLRHPIREARIRRRATPEDAAPADRDLWLWDEKSAQAVQTWASRERRRLMSAATPVRAAAATLRRLGPLVRAHRALAPEAFAHPVDMAGRWGLSVEPRPESWTRERALVPAHPGLPVLIRLYRHKGGPHWTFAIEAGRELAAAGCRVSFALCQDRRAVAEPSLWRAMCEQVIPAVAGFAEFIEVGHAINRVKWGLWDLREYRHLAAPVAGLRRAFPALQWIGPGGIDFEYPQVLAALDSLPDDTRFDALSLHLYVDRRGAPENPQGLFHALDKFRLARAMAQVVPRCGGRLIVSEVNWPLEHTGIFSPVCSPFMFTKKPFGPPNVEEDVYARYMARYLAQAVCSGFVERVYWWRLAAHGFGLVDDRAEPWRPRPAYRAWTRMLELAGCARFERNLPAGPDAYVHLFRRPDGERIALGYAYRGRPGLRETCPALIDARAEALDGRSLDATPRALTEDPVWFRGIPET